MILSQIVLLPLLLLFVWGYLALRPESRRRSALLLFDAVVVVCAFVFSLTAVWILNDMYAVRDNNIWLVVMSTVATFHVFPAVLLTGWYLRKKVFAAA